MNELAVLFRFKQFLTHNLHNLASRVAFLSDHEYLGEIYSKAEGHYDGVVERMIGLGSPVDLNAIQLQAAQKLKSIPATKDNTEMFSILLSINKNILSQIETACKSGTYSQGTINLLAGQADELEVEQYKISRRIAK